MTTATPVPADRWQVSCPAERSWSSCSRAVQWPLSVWSAGQCCPLDTGPTLEVILISSLSSLKWPKCFRAGQKISRFSSFYFHVKFLSENHNSNREKWTKKLSQTIHLRTSSGAIRFVFQSEKEVLHFDKMHRYPPTKRYYTWKIWDVQQEELHYKDVSESLGNFFDLLKSS